MALTDCFAALVLEDKSVTSKPHPNQVFLGLLRRLENEVRAKGFQNPTSIVSKRLLELVARSPTFAAQVREHPEQVPLAQVRNLAHQRGIDGIRQRKSAGDAAAELAVIQRDEQEAGDMVGIEELQAACLEQALEVYVAWSRDPEESKATVAFFRLVCVDGATQDDASKTVGLAKRTAQRRLVLLKRFAAKWIDAALGEAGA